MRRGAVRPARHRHGLPQTCYTRHRTHKHTCMQTGVQSYSTSWLVSGVVVAVLVAARQPSSLPDLRRAIQPSALQAGVKRARPVRLRSEGSRIVAARLAPVATLCRHCSLGAGMPKHSRHVRQQRAVRDMVAAASSSGGWAWAPPAARLPQPNTRTTVLLAQGLRQCQARACPQWRGDPPPSWLLPAAPRSRCDLSCSSPARPVITHPHCQKIASVKMCETAPRPAARLCAGLPHAGSVCLFPRSQNGRR